MFINRVVKPTALAVRSVKMSSTPISTMTLEKALSPAALSY